MNKEQKNRFNF